jgi:hypothetical protein
MECNRLTDMKIEVRVPYLLTVVKEQWPFCQSMSRKCGKKRVRRATNCCASGFPQLIAQPSVSAFIGGMEVKTLIDSGCSRSILSPSVARHWFVESTQQEIVMMNGKSVRCCGTCSVRVTIQKKTIVLSCLVTDILAEFDMLLGMDGITALGGVLISKEGVPVFSCVAFEDVMKIDDQDFSASFMDGKWVIRWKWKEGIQDPILENTIAHYRIDEVAREEFDVEVNEWIRQGWLQPYQGRSKG